MKTILITGGTGNLGSHILQLLDDSECDINVLSSQSNPDLPVSARVLHADITNLDSLKKLDFAFDVIIHCASNPPQSKVVDIEGTKNLLNSINKNSNPHFIYISIVGVDQSDWPYYQNKLQVENMVKASGLPFSILRITQFHDFVLDRVLKPLAAAAKGHIELPKGMQFQSIDITEAAKSIVDIINSPTNDTQIIGGPEVTDIKALAAAYLAYEDSFLSIEEVGTDNPFFEVFTTGINLCPEHAKGSITWKEYLYNQEN